MVVEAQRLEVARKISSPFILWLKACQFVNVIYFFRRRSTDDAFVVVSLPYRFFDGGFEVALAFLLLDEVLRAPIAPRFREV